MTTDITQLRGIKVLDPTGDTIGKVEDIYLDDRTNEPEWLLVNTGLFGTKSTFIPLQGADQQDDGVVVPFEKAQVKDAPNMDAEGHLSQADEARLYEYYGIPYTEAPVDGGLSPTAPDAHGTVGHDTSGPTTDDAMTRSEEQGVGTTGEEAERLRLRRHVTENARQTIPVQREEVRIEREPITDVEGDGRV